MSPKLVFLPVLAHMLLVYVLFIRLGIEKTKAVKAGLADRQTAALNPKAWPDNVVKISNNIGNQFETPILFYMLSVVIFLTESVNSVALALLGVYVASRYVHAYIHVTSNYVPHRFKTFLVGTVLLIGLTLWQLTVLLSLV